jgi:hypothetical protein
VFDLVKEKQLTKKQIIKILEVEPRAIFSMEFADQCLKAFWCDAKFSKQEVVFFDSTGLNMNQRATGKPNSVGVGADDISIKLVEAYGKKPVTMKPYLGAGRNAEHITTENLKILKVELLLEKVL